MLKKLLATLSFGFIACIAVIIVIINQVWHFWIQSPKRIAEPVPFEVEAGEGFGTIATRLKSEEFIANAFWFKVYAKLDGSARLLQAGQFTVTPGMNYASIVDVLTDAKKDEVTLTIPEGYNVKQIGALVVQNFDITEAQWRVATGVESPQESHPFVVVAGKPDSVDLEGYLFPDTYRFFKNATADDIVKRMIDETERKTAGLSPTGYKNWHEALTLASIIEREVRGAADMRQVSDIFRKRLGIGMALQADSTVNYITGKETPSITLADRDIDSPYNTYKYAGLPPGGISSPGLDAIKAAVSPASNNYWYFLTSPQGTVYYATTFAEHIRNRDLYLR